MRNIVCISGTSRPDNFTSRALAVVVEEFKQQNETTQVFDARDMHLGFPGSAPTNDAKELKAAVEQATGVVIASPEYHGGICAMTKLIIENLGFPSLLAGKPVGLVGVAAGRIGAIKSLEQLKSICSHVGAIVVPGAISIAGVQSVFDDDGRWLDEGSEAALRSVATAMSGFMRDFICPKYILEQAVRGGDGPWSTST